MSTELEKHEKDGQNSSLDAELNPQQQKLLTKIKIKLSISLILLIIILGLAYMYVETSLKLQG